jgi:hypothetical protein
MKSVNKNLAMVLMGIVAMSTGGVYALTQEVQTTQSTPATTTVGQEIPVILGHLQIVAKDKYGNIKAYRQTDNLVVSNGLNETVNYLFGSGLQSTTDTTLGTIKYVGVGTSATAVTYKDVELNAQQSSKRTGTVTAINAGGGGGMGAQIAATWTGGGTGALNNNTGSAVNIQEAGLFDSPTNSTTGTASNLYAHQTFSSIAINSGDSLTVTWKITFASSNP